MFIRRVHRHITAWLAALALLLGSLLPLVSHAVVSAPADGSGWVEVCTVSGMAWVQTDAGDPSAGTQLPVHDMAQDRCDWCASHSPLSGLPPVAHPLAAPLAFGPELPPAFLHAPRPLFVWAAAHSRAPPAFA